MLGALAMAHPAWQEVRNMASLIAKLSNSRLAILAAGGNAAGGWLSGAVPHRLAGNAAIPAREASEAGNDDDVSGLDWRAMLDADLGAYLLTGVDPALDCADPAAATAALKKAGCVVALSSFHSETLEACADIILPVGSYAESSGTLINVEGRLQTFQGVIQPLGESRPAWKVLRVLGNAAGVDGFDYFSSAQVAEEANQAIGDIRGDNKITWTCPETLQPLAATDGLCSVGEVPIYSVDSMVRHSGALQQTPDGLIVVGVRINPVDAERLGVSGAEQVELSHGGGTSVLNLIQDAAVAPGCVLLPYGVAESAGFGAAGADVALQAVADADSSAVG
jgi:NADH-quinone oxidoreductase subunit G